MSNFVEHFRKSQGLLGAMNAITDRRAFITLYCTFAVAALLIAGFGAGVASLMINGHFDLGKALGLIGVLATGAVFLIGISATGFLLNDSARGREQKSIGQALLFSIATLHRILGVLLILLVIALLTVLISFLAIFLCKIPALGPILYSIVFPVSVLVLGATFYAGFFIVSLHGPAIWEGHKVFRAVAVLGAVFRQRLFATIIQMILLALLVFLVATLVFAGIGAGISLVSAMSFPLLGQGLGLDSLNPMAIFGGMMTPGGDTGAYLKAGVFGMTLLLGITLSAPLLVAISGNCIIFANMTEDLSTAEIDQRLQGAINVARSKTEQARRQLGEARDQLNTPSAPPASSALLCPNCAAAAAPDDVFCGACGKRIV